MTITCVAIGVFGLLAFLSIHFIAWQVLPARRKNVMVLAMIACAGYVVAALGAQCLLHLPFLVHAPVSLSVHLFLGVTYFHFYYGVDRSLSVRMLGVLTRAEQGRLGVTELKALYSKEDMIRRRLNILVEHGWLVERDGAYSCTAKARRIARLARLGARIYRVEAAG